LIERDFVRFPFADLCGYFATFAFMLPGLTAKNAKKSRRNAEGMQIQSAELPQQLMDIFAGCRVLDATS
jgi:hypothetical protein